MKSSFPGTLEVVDLSHDLSNAMPVFPGTQPPRFRVTATLEAHGFAEKRMALCSHTGTHVDAPAHIIAGAPGLDRIGVSRFVGRAMALDVSRAADARIELDDLVPFRDRIARTGFVLLHTGWNRLWGSAAYFQGYPALTPEAAGWLAEFDLSGVGVDAVSIDRPGARPLPVHEILLARQILIIENLTGLEQLLEKDFLFCCFPLKILGADGSPVRAVALAPEPIPRHGQLG